MEMKYPFEWEMKAFDELFGRFAFAWQTNKKLFYKLTKENNDLGISSFQIPILWNGIEGYPAFLLLQLIIDKLIRQEPYLCRCLAYIMNFPPEDFMARLTFLEKYLRGGFSWKGCTDVLNTDVLKDSDLAKQHQLTGIPVQSCLVGRVLQALLTVFSNYYLLDLAKLLGAQESIEELRTKRLQITKDGWIHDYSPIFKLCVVKKDIIVEVFHEEIFSDLFESVDKNMDNFLAMQIIRTQSEGKGDRRKDDFFGNAQIYDKDGFRNIPIGDKIILKYCNNTKEIPAQLLPRWFGDILKLSHGYDLTRLGTYRTKKDGTSNRIKQDEISEATLGLYFGALKWPGTGDVKPYLRTSMKGVLGEAFKEVSIGNHQKGENRKKEWKEIKQSIEDYARLDSPGQAKRTQRKGILLEDMDRFKGGSLDDPIKSDKSNWEAKTKQEWVLVEMEGEKSERAIDFLKTVSPEDALIKIETLNKIKQDDPRLAAILEKMLAGEKINRTDQRYCERKIKILQEFLNNN